MHLAHIWQLDISLFTPLPGSADLNMAQLMQQSQAISCRGPLSQARQQQTSSLQPMRRPAMRSRSQTCGVKSTPTSDV